MCPLLGYDRGTGLIEDINFDGGYLAILVSGAELTVNRSRFANLNNNGSSSSAIHVNSSAGAGVIVNDSIIENSRASYYGVTMVSTGSITFNRSLIRNNTSTAYTTATISTYSFSNSSATIRIYNSTLQNNRSNAWGAVNSTIGTLDIRHSTFIDNDGAPAVRISPDVGPVNATIRGSIIRPGASGGSACEVGSGVLGASSTGNVIGDSTCTGLSPETNILGASTAGIGLLPVADVGGPTPVAALSADSVAIDAAGDCTSVLNPAVDQRGQARPSGDACDAGAFEFSRGATVAFVSQASSPGNTRSPQFAFEAEGDYGGFECRFYRQGEEPGPFGECESPYVPALDGEDDGTFVIEVRALDTNGDPTDSTATATYELDTTPPVTEILYPSSPFRSRPDLPDFHFEIESNARAECRVDSGSWEQCSSPWSPPSDLEAGRHQIRIRAIDRAGNAESPHIIDVLIDNQAFVKAARKTLKPNRKGKVELKLTCPKSEWMSCFVWPIRIDTAKKVATRKGGGKNVLKVANVRDAYYIRSGKSRTVRFRLPGKVRRALQVNGTIPLIAKVQVEDELGNIESRRLRLKLRR